MNQKLRQADNDIATMQTRLGDLQAKLNQLLSRQGGTVSGQVDLSTHLQMAEIDAPAYPEASKDRLYFKSDHHLYAMDHEGNETDLTTGIALSGAPENAEYLVLTLNSTLTNERRLVFSTGLSVVDGGAGGDYTVTASLAGVDHGDLDGLTDDDHTQYLNTARHDTTTRHTIGTVVPHDDHGALSGLSDDDHPQYPRIATTETITGIWTFQADIQLDADLDFVGAQSITTTTGDLKIAPTGDLVFDPNGNDVLPVTHRDLNLGSPSLWYKSLYVDLLNAGTIKTVVFESDVINVFNGSFMVAKSSASLAVGKTFAASGADTLVVNETGRFEVGDILRLKDLDSDTYLTVAGIGSDPTINVTISSGGGEDFVAGTPVVNYGSSGQGLILMTANDIGAVAAPAISVFSHAGSPWSATTEYVRLGNLDNLADYTGDAWGIFVGDYAGDAWMSYDPTNGLRIHGNGLIDGTLTAEKLDIGDLGMFNATDGVLLLGPGCPMTATSWTSLRGYKATIAGAFHPVPSKWAEAQALMVEEARTNYCVHASFEVWAGGAPTGWTAYGTPTTTQETTIVRQGASSCYIVDNVAGDLEGYYQDVAGLTPSSSYRVSAWVYVVSGTASLYAFDGGGYSNSVHVATSVSGRWVRLEVTKVCPAGGSIRVLVGGSSGNNTVIFDMVQVELGTYSTTDIYYALGSGYTGTEAGTSTRAATRISIPASGKLNVPGPNTIHVVAYVPWVYNDTVVHVLFDTGAAANQNRLILYAYQGTLHTWLYGATANGWRAVSYTLPATFGSGQFHEFAATLDSNGSPTGLYLDGVLVASTYSTDGTWTTPTAWGTNAYLGSNLNGAGGESWNGALCQVALFGVELTAEEIARIYQAGKPLADNSMSNAPGVYILDGKFQVSSSTGTTRIEINPDEIVGYNAGDKQFYLSAEDGKAYAGGGNIVMSAEKYIEFFDGSGTILGSLGWEFGYGLSPAEIELNARSAATGFPVSGLKLAGYAALFATGANMVVLNGDGLTNQDALTGAVNTYWRLTNAGALGIRDGITAPSTDSELAMIYIDTADGKPKIKYSNGTVETIVTS